jgi:PilZ domain
LHNGRVGRTLDGKPTQVTPGITLLRASTSLAVESVLGAGKTQESVDARSHRRFKIEVDIRVYPRERPVVRGATVDISESGISALLRVEVPVGEVVRLEFTLPAGDVEALAMVRQKSAFRYGFQFLETGRALEIIRRTCGQLAVEQAPGEHVEMNQP